MTSLVAQLVKNLPAMWETRVQSLGWEDPMEKKMKAPHLSILAWEHFSPLGSLGQGSGELPSSPQPLPSALQKYRHHGESQPHKIQAGPPHTFLTRVSNTPQGQGTVGPWSSLGAHVQMHYNSSTLPQESDSQLWLFSVLVFVNHTPANCSVPMFSHPDTLPSLA